MWSKKLRLICFEIFLEPIIEEEVESDEKMMNQLRYLETLNNFKGEGFVMDILRAELTDKSVVNYKLSFIYTNQQKGPEIANKIISYINTNEYFNKVKAVYAANAKAKIENNTKLIQQIDDVVENYSNSLKINQTSFSNKEFFVDQEPLNVPSLLSLKNRFIEDIEEKQVELNQQSSIVSILNMGKTQALRKSFLNRRLVQVPLALLFGFFLYCFLKYLNTKSKEIA